MTLFSLAKGGKGIIQMSMVAVCLYKKTNGIMIDGDNLSEFIKECGQFRVVGFEEASGRSGGQVGLTDNITVLHCGEVKNGELPERWNGNRSEEVGAGRWSRHAYGYSKGSKNHRRERQDGWDHRR